MLLVDLLFDCAFILLRAIGLDPRSSANSKVSESLIWLASLSDVFIPIIPWSNLIFNRYFNSLIIPGKSSENVRSVATTILFSESRAMPLLLKSSFYLGL